MSISSRLFWCNSNTLLRTQIINSSKNFGFGFNFGFIGQLITREFNSNRSALVRIHRLKYLQQYPTTLVNPDGSTYTIRYHEPRRLIKLPFDITFLSESEKKIHLERRKPKTRIDVSTEDTVEVDFDSKKYLKFMKK